MLNPNDIRLLVSEDIFFRDKGSQFIDSKENQLKQKKKEEEEKEKAVRRVCVKSTQFSSVNLRSV